MTRTTEEVFRDHLACRKRKDLAGDLEKNYADDLIVLSKDGAYRGKDGIRTTAAILHKWLPDATYSYDIMRVEDDIAFLVWSAVAGNGMRTCDGADSFVIRDGRIAVQTIHYHIHE